MIEDLKRLSALPVKGFMPDHEAARLYALALEASCLGPCLEIGSYCGKSTLFIGAACRKNKATLFSVDHHAGSEEQQPGQEYFDPELYDEKSGRVDTFPLFRKALNMAGLEDTVVAMVAKSHVAARQWATPLAMVFIDGGHTFEAACTDYVSWVSHIMPGGLLVVHDLFEDPAKGGQAPYYVYSLALASGLFEPLPRTDTLGALRRKGGWQGI